MSFDRQNEINRITAIIDKLSQKTVENGCTESEAVAAAAKVKELLQQYDLNLTDADFNKNKTSCVFGYYDNPNPNNRHSVDYCGPAIAELCNCIVYRDQETRKYVFFGFPHDVKYAVYLMDFCYNYIENSTKKYKLTPAYVNRTKHGRALVTQFSNGCGVGLARKINTMIQNMKVEETSDCKDIVIRKEIKVKQEFSEKNFKLSKPAARKVKAGDAFQAGLAKGLNAQINKPVDGSDSNKEMVA